LYYKGYYESLFFAIVSITYFPRRSLQYKSVIAAKKALILVKGAFKLPHSDSVSAGYLDVWWVIHDGGLLLLIPHLLTLHRVCHIYSIAACEKTFFVSLLIVLSVPDLEAL
jgi:hypothetical protein